MGKAQRAASILEGVCALAVVLAVWGAQLTTGWLDGLDRFTYDASIRTTGAVPSPDIRVIAIDEASLAEFGAWPWPLDVHAEMVRGLSRAGSRAVVFIPSLKPPLNFAAKTSLRRAVKLAGSEPTLANEVARLSVAFDSDADLARSIANHGGVVLIADTDQDIASQPDTGVPTWANSSLLPAGVDDLVVAGTVQWPDDALGQAAAGVGHRVLQPDADGTLRSHHALLATGKLALPSVALAAARGGSRISRSKNGAIKLDKHSLSLSGQSLLRPIFYSDRGGVSPFGDVSYVSVLRGDVSAESFKDKYVLIGFTARALDPGIASPLGPAIPAVEMFAHMTSSVLQRDLISKPAWVGWGQVLAALAVLGLVAGCLPWVRLAYGAVACVVCVSLLMLIEWVLLTQFLLWIALAVPAACALTGLVVVMGLRVARTGQTPVARPTVQQRVLGDALLAQSQLDLAWAHYRALPLIAGQDDDALMDSLYRLGCSFEQRGDVATARGVYSHMAAHDATYKDLALRLGRAPQPEATPVAGGPVQLGCYEVERELGRGAMGAVLLGVDRTMSRQVALKTLALSQEFEGQALTEARQRFFREAETAGRLRHRDIVTIFDAGEDSGLAYIAMEFLSGHDLQRYTHPGELLPVVKVLSIVARVAEALAHAHRQGVVHRDIKPANVMVDLASNSVKVTDFGIARITDSSRTRTGVVLGTPSYMSPEQMAGRRVDGRSDLFSLGVMLFQLLCGRLPHKAESMAALMHQIANQQAPDVRTLRPELPEALANVAALVLQKRPEMRYADGHQLALDLESVAQQLETPKTLEEVPPPETVATPPESSTFPATLKVPRVDPGHNRTE